MITKRCKTGRLSFKPNIHIYSNLNNCISPGNQNDGAFFSEDENTRTSNIYGKK